MTVPQLILSLSSMDLCTLMSQSAEGAADADAEPLGQSLVFTNSQHTQAHTRTATHSYAAAASVRTRTYTHTHPSYTHIYNHIYLFKQFLTVLFMARCITSELRLNTAYKNALSMQCSVLLWFDWHATPTLFVFS